MNFSFKNLVESVSQNECAIGLKGLIEVLQETVNRTKLDLDLHQVSNVNQQIREFRELDFVRGECKNSGHVGTPIIS